MFRLLASALVASLLTASAALAHHSFAMFDRTVEKIVTGTVARWQFNAPHSWLYLNVKNADGTETLWSFEGSAPPSLLTRGITGRTLRAWRHRHRLVLSDEGRTLGGRPWMGEAGQRHLRESFRRRL